jgi:hypothetical protein
MTDRKDLMSLPAVLAWAYTRDREFTDSMNVTLELERLEKAEHQPAGDYELFTRHTAEGDGRWPVNVAFSEFNNRRNRQTAPVIGSISDAWHVIRYEISNRNLEIVGFPYFCGPTNLSTPHAFWLDTSLWLLKDTGPKGIGSVLTLELAPRPGLMAQGSELLWWRDVQIDCRIVDSFPPLLIHPNAPSDPNSSKTALLQSAVAALWPIGEWKSLTAKQMHKSVCKWARETFEEHRSAAGAPVSLTTVARFIERNRPAR